MKTSTSLVILLFAFSLLAMIGSDLSLKRKFENIDKKDPYFGYSKESVKPFKYVKLTGNFFGYTQIEPGKSFEIRTTDFHNYSNPPKIDWEINGDTLHLNYGTQGQKFPFNNSIFLGAPQVYIAAPQLSGIHSIGITSAVKGWQNGSFSVVQKGNGILFTDNHLDNLSIDVQSGGNVKIVRQNFLGNTNVLVKDSSSLTADKDVFKSFQMKVDSAAHVGLPGSLIRKNSKL